MTTPELIRRLATAGVTLRSDGRDRLHVTGPKGVVDANLLQTLRDRKGEVIGLLRDGATGHAGVQQPLQGPSAEEVDQLWSQVAPSDYRHLTTSRRPVPPCMCCGGRSRHSATCQMMRREGFGVL